MSRSFGRRYAPLLPVAALAGCTAVIDQSTFYPEIAAPRAELIAPQHYQKTEAMVDLPDLGRMHVVRLDNPSSDTTIIYSGGNSSFVSGGSPTAAALASATGADLILYDYPGRGGTTVPPTIEAAIETGPALVKKLREMGWIVSGPLFSYGVSLGGSQAAAIARSGGFSGIIIEGSAADLATVGRNFIPGIAKPFVRIRVHPALSRFDYVGYAIAAKAPVLLISSEGDDVVRPANMRDFADALKLRGAKVTFVSVPGKHGTALGQSAARAAVGEFVRAASEAGPAG